MTTMPRTVPTGILRSHQIEITQSDLVLSWNDKAAREVNHRHRDFYHNVLEQYYRKVACVGNRYVHVLSGHERILYELPAVSPIDLEADRGVFKLS